MGIDESAQILLGACCLAAGGHCPVVLSGHVLIEEFPCRLLYTIIRSASSMCRSEIMPENGETGVYLDWNIFGSCDHK